MDVRAGPQRRLSTKGLMPLNCGAGQDVRVPLGRLNPKGKQPRIVTGRTDAEAPILWLSDAEN